MSSIRSTTDRRVCSTWSDASDGIALNCRFPGLSDAYANAMAESAFASLECGLIDRRSFQSDAEARRHSALAYHSPINYEGAMPT